MTKSELIAKLADAHPHLSPLDVERTISVVFDEISNALTRGDRVELRDFGAFTVKPRSARIGRNPKTGEAVSVDERLFPRFKTGKGLRLRINGQT